MGSLRAVSSRRRALGLLGGAIAGGLAAAAGLGADGAQGGAEAEKGRNRTCRGGTIVGLTRVHSTGPGSFTPFLRRERHYRLRAVGYWNSNTSYGQDAIAAFPLNNHNAPEREYQGTRLGLSLDGGSPDEWGAYNRFHIYERQVVGRGVGLNLRNTDPVTAENFGTLFVEVYECD